MWWLVLASVGIVIPVLGLAVARVRSASKPWTTVDVVVALLLMVWLGAIASAAVAMALPDELAQATIEGRLSDNPSLLLFSLLAANLVGVGSAAVFARLRAGPGTLGFDLSRPVWLLWAVSWMIPLSAVWFAWVWALEALGFTVEEQLLAKMLVEIPPSPVWGAMLIYVITVVPVIEEVVFRGFVQAPFVRQWGTKVGIFVSSALFAGAHLSDPQAVLPLFVLALVLGWLRERTGSLAAPTALHVANNAAALTVTLWF